MKRSLLKRGVPVCLFLALCCAAGALARPIIARARAALDGCRVSLERELADLLSLGVSYRSLSPALFPAIRVKDIAVFNAENGKTLAHIEQALFLYSVAGLLKGSPAPAVSKLVLRGVAVEYDSREDGAVGAKLSALLRAPPRAGDGGTRPFELPFGVSVQNCAVHAALPQADAALAVKTLKLDAAPDGVYAARLSGSLRVRFPDPSAVPAALRPCLGDVSGSFAVSGTVPPALSGSSLSVSLSELAAGTLKFGSLGFRAAYADNTLRFSSVQGNLPVSFEGDFSPASGALRLRLHADPFEPLSACSFRPEEHPQLHAFRGALVSGDYSAAVSLPGRTVEYAALGSATLPERVCEAAGGALTADFALSGDAKRLNVAAFRASAPVFDAALSGSVDLRTLQPSGTAELARYTLPNGNTLSATVSVSPLARGFRCVVPRLALGERSLSALRLEIVPDRESVGFSLEALDGSSGGAYSPGAVRISGSSGLSAQNGARASVSVENLSMASALGMASYLLPREAAQKISALLPALEPFALTHELDVSTDFRSLSYQGGVPHAVVSDRRTGCEELSFSLSGDQNAARLDLRAANRPVQASVRADFSLERREAAFQADAVIGENTYRLSGKADADSLAVSGDYGLSAALFYGAKSGSGGISGSLSVSELPVPAQNRRFALTVGALFSYSEERGIRADFSPLALTFDGVDGEARVALSGSLEDGKITLNEVDYADSASRLAGSGMLSWNNSDAVFDSASASLTLSDTAGSGEAYGVRITAINPARKPLSLSALKNDFVYDGTLSLTKSAAAHFLRNQRAENTVTADIAFSGSAADPSVSLRLAASSINVGDSPLILQGEADFRNRTLAVSSSASWQQQSLRDVALKFFPDTFEGSVSGIYCLQNGAKDAMQKSPFRNASRSKRLPRSARPPGVSAATEQPFRLDLARQHDSLVFHTSDGKSVNGVITGAGTVQITLGGLFPMHAAVSGSVSDSALNLDVADIFISLAPFAPVLRYPFIAVFGGTIQGQVHLGGQISAPEFTGELVGKNIELSVPDYVPQHLVAETVNIALAPASEGFADGDQQNQSGSPDMLGIEREKAQRNPTNQLYINKALFRAAKGGGTACTVALAFNRWAFEYIDLHIATHEAGGEFVKAEVKIPAAFIQAEGSCDLRVFASPDAVFVEGNISGRNGSVEILSEGKDTAKSGLPNAEVFADLHITVGNRVQVSYRPLFRGLVTPGAELVFRMNGTDSVEFIGEIAFRSGEISYFGRNFYLKEGQGRISFDKQHGVDPVITVKAETREYDENGRQVQIFLNAVEQSLSEFMPVYTASPAKSEAEIMQLLGYLIIGNTPAKSVSKATDIMLQSLFVSKLEDTLRERLNFDIFSMQIPAIQNWAKNQTGVGNGQMTLGKAFDNTSVYIGKYFSAPIFGDMLVRLAYDETHAQGSDLLFQPEFGFAMDSPFALVRLAFAPELGGSRSSLLSSTWVPAASITLSWKTAF
jgi:hypothetical protein